METLKKHFETINRQSFVETLSKFCRSDLCPTKFRQNFVEVLSKLCRSFVESRHLWAHKGPIWLKKLIILMKNHKSMNKNIKIVNLEILKVKTWFGDKDLFS